MSQADRTFHSLDAPYHPVSHYDSPRAVLRDHALSTAEKRAILSSWASDIYAMESAPGLRKIPGLPQPMRLADILSALRRLDEDDGPPRPGGVPMRILRGADAEAVRPAIAYDRARWNREANIRRYRKLLRTRLSEHERQFVERRLGEELSA
jgi:hypothetical protein